MPLSLTINIHATSEPCNSFQRALKVAKLYIFEKYRTRAFQKYIVLVHFEQAEKIYEAPKKVALLAYNFLVIMESHK